MENYSLAQHSIQEWRDRVETIEVERRRERNELAEANAIDREEWETEREKVRHCLYLDVYYAWSL